MKQIILYGSIYGSTRGYAETLSRATGIPACSYKDAPELSDMDRIVYLGPCIPAALWGCGKP